MRKINEFILKNKYDFLFIFFLILISWLYNYPNILTSRPYSIHQWRQTDCLSITMNYYKENRNFFEPAVYWVGEKDGKTVSECPLIYYSVGQLWKIFGYHEFIFRILNILIVFTGLFCLYKILDRFLSDIFWSFTITFLLFTSPILVYYTNNFTADAPALGLALIGCFLIMKGFNTGKKIYFYLFFFFFILAGLIKISSLIIFIAILFTHILLIYKKRNEKHWFYKWYSLIPYFFVFYIIFLWYNYATLYNQKNLPGIFLTGIYPIWEIDAQTRKNIWLSLKNELIPAYFNKKALFIILTLLVFSIFSFKKVNKFLLSLSIFFFLGTISYLILFYQAFTVHDYYLTNLLLFIPLVLITSIEWMKRNFPKTFNQNFIKSIALIALLLLIYETAVINRLKYSANDWLAKNNFVLSNDTFNQWRRYHENYTNHYKAYETISPYLRKIGMKQTDRVLSLPDESINISLYLMGQKGFTGFGYGDKSFDEKMKLYKENGVKYLIIDKSIINENYLQPYLDEKIGQYKNLNIYKI
jgi:hypothetical protein